MEVAVTYDWPSLESGGELILLCVSGQLQRANRLHFLLFKRWIFIEVCFEERNPTSKIYFGWEEVGDYK